MTILKNNRGAVIVFVALFFALLFLFLGFATDAGWMVYVRSQAQARVDAAALAAAAALIEKDEAQREIDAGNRAAALASDNTVVNTSVTTSLTDNLAPMFYDYSADPPTLTEAVDWTPENCNAVRARVENGVPTPLFFSGIRNWFGASENGSTNIHVEAVAYLGCPGEAQPAIPVVMCAQYIDYPNDCQVPDLYQVPSAGNSAFTDFNTTYNCKKLVEDPSLIPGVSVGDDLRLINGQIDGCLKDIEDKYLNECVLLPIVNCPSGQLVQDNPVVGFAKMCITDIETQGSDKFLKGTLTCETSLAGPGTGECFGVVAQNPILVK